MDVAVGNEIFGLVQFGPIEPLWAGVIYNYSTYQGKSLETDLLGTTNQFITVALEGHNLETDSDLFGTTDFENLYVSDPNYQRLYPSWNGVVSEGTEEYFTNLDVIVYNHSHVRLQTAR